MKALRLIAVVIAALLFLPGCWDQKELNEVAVVIGVGIDTGENGQFAVTAQVIKPTTAGSIAGSGGSELPTWSVTATGATFLDAISELNRVSPRRLYWPHLQIIVFGEEFAKQGIAPVITWFEKSRDSRSGTYIAVTQGRAEQLLNQKIELGNVPAKAMADLIANAEIRQLPARQMTLRKLISILTTPGVDIAADIIVPRKIRGKVETYELAGTAYFVGSKLAGYVTNEAVHGLAIANNTYANATLKARCPEDEQGYFTFQVTDFRSKLHVSHAGGRVTGTFDIFAEGNLLDQTCRDELLGPGGLPVIERRVADKMTAMLRRMFEEAAEEGSDVYGIGRELRRRHPTFWRETKADWRERLREVRIETEIELNVRRTGLVQEPTINKME